MYTYSQLIKKNLILAAVFAIAFTSIAFFLVSNEIKNEQQNQQKLLQLILSQQNISTDHIATQLKAFQAANSFTKLSARSSNNEVIFQFEDKISTINTLFQLTPTTFSINNSNINITIQINPSAQVNTVIILCIIMATLSFALVFFGGMFSVNRYKNIIQSINEQIKQALTEVLDHSKADKKEPLFDLPELNAGIADIKKQINSHIQDTTSLEKEAYVEPLTQLENRARFVQFFEEKDKSIEFGVLTITRCSELQTINQIHGYSEGDNYICKVANILKKATQTYQGAKVFRLNSSDFATILPNTTLKDAENYGQDITSYFNEYQQASDLDSVGYTGLVYFDKTNPLGELLALADTAISVAQTQHINAWFAQTSNDILDNSSASYGNQNWRQEIDSVLENHRIKLLVQNIKPTSRSAKVYGEILARFLNDNDEMLPTASFIAMAEKLDKIVSVDKMIIEKVIAEIESKNLINQHFGVNISARSIHDEHFLIWLERRLLKEPAIASNLIFEISEFGLQQNIKTSKRFIDMVHRTGARITVERFGVGLTSFKFFRDLKPDFIKMDSTYTRDIDEDKNNQYFLRLMVDLAHRLSITVLAESVEGQEEKFMLEKLFIDGCQGFYIGKPEPI